MRRKKLEKEQDRTKSQEWTNGDSSYRHMFGGHEKECKQKKIFSISLSVGLQYEAFVFVRET